MAGSALLLPHSAAFTTTVQYHQPRSARRAAGPQRKVVVAGTVPLCWCTVECCGQLGLRFSRLSKLCTVGLHLAAVAVAVAKLQSVLLLLLLLLSQLRLMLQVPGRRRVGEVC